MSDVLIYHEPSFKTTDNREVPAIDYELKEIGPRAIDPKYIDFEVVGPAKALEGRAKDKPAKKKTLHVDVVRVLRGKQVEANERAKLASENDELKRRIAELEAQQAGEAKGVDPSKINVGDDTPAPLGELTKKELIAIAGSKGIAFDAKATKAEIVAAIEAADANEEE